MPTDFPHIDAETAVARAIRSRRTIHNFAGERPPDALLEQAINLACQAPNHRLTEPWRFYLIGPDTAAGIVALNTELVRTKRGDKAAENKRARWAGIPGMLVVTSRRSDDARLEREDYAATCCAIQNLTLFLWSEGVGMKWGTGSVTRDDRLYDLLGIDRDAERIAGLFFYGYPADIPTSPRTSGADLTTRLP